MEYQKCCPVCRTNNPAHEVMCIKCLADISKVSPTPVQIASMKTVNGLPISGAFRDESKTVGRNASAAMAPEKPRLRLKFDAFDLEVIDGDVVGRNGIGKDVLAKYPGVSRKHALFTYQNSKWFIEDLETTNGTYLNGVLLSSDKKHEIKPGDRVRISKKATFQILQAPEAKK